MKSGAYDAERDALLLAEPMLRWAKAGFMRGLAGVRNEILPKGRTELPSAALRQAKELLSFDGIDPQEATRRRQYLEDLERRVREIQSRAVAKHYQGAAWGQVADMAIALKVAVISLALLHEHGAFHWIPIILITAFAVKLLFMRRSAKRILTMAEEAFRADKTKVVFPWDRAPEPY